MFGQLKAESINSTKIVDDVRRKKKSERIVYCSGISRKFSALSRIRSMIYLKKLTHLYFDTEQERERERDKTTTTTNTLIPPPFLFSLQTYTSSTFLRTLRYPNHRHRLRPLHETWLQCPQGSTPSYQTWHKDYPHK